MEGKDWDRVVVVADQGIALCDQFTYEPLKPECDKMVVEFTGIKVKAEAKKAKTNALTLKE